MKMPDLLPKTLPESHALILSMEEEILSMEEEILSIESQKNILLSENASLLQKYEYLLEQFRLSRQRQFSPSSESSSQLELVFDEAEATVSENIPEEESTITVSYERKTSPKRKPLPAELPREVIVHDIPEEEKVCACGCLKKCIGEEVTEQLKFVPASLCVIAHKRPKYACNRCDEGVSCAAMPSLFLPKSMASESVVAHAIVSKYEDHLPLYRQEKIWERMGIEMPRNTVSGWIIKAFEICTPMRDAIIRELVSSDYVQADETPVQVLNEPDRKPQSRSYMWVYQTGRPDRKVILFDYRETRQAVWPMKILDNFSGTLQTDGYKGYDWVDKNPDIIHAGCMAHARRPFAELVKLAKTTGKSHQAIAFFQKLYAIEKEAKEKNLSFEQRLCLRQEKAIPILEEMRKWLDNSLIHAQPQSKLKNALLYMHERWEALTHYASDGKIEIDNNSTENKIRPFALGRKNWLFAATPNGANASALFYSLIATARASGWQPFEYLLHLFQNIRSCKSPEDYSALLPFNIIK